MASHSVIYSQTWADSEEGRLAIRPFVREPGNKICKIQKNMCKIVGNIGYQISKMDSVSGASTCKVLHIQSLVLPFHSPGSVSACGEK